MKVKISVFSLLAALIAGPAVAGWQYDGYYIRDGRYDDDGSRFIISARGGLSLGRGRIKNEVGSLYGYYYMNDANGNIISEQAYDNAGSPTGYTYVGYGDLSTLHAKKDYSKTAFTAGASLGFTIPHHQQWRLEAGYDHISETDYNQIPMFEGNLNLTGGDTGNVVAHVSSSGVSSTLSTDVVSVMAYYDFFDGVSKPINEFIPYVGFGVGYAMSKTTLKLSDIYGDLSTDSDLQNFGTVGTDGVIQFDNPVDKNKYPTSDNIAVLAGLGVAYGISQYTFLDAGLRVMYIPKTTWEISNTDGSLHRSWFSAENMFYTDFVLGIRFEF